MMNEVIYLGKSIGWKGNGQRRKGIYGNRKNKPLGRNDNMFYFLWKSCV